MKYDVFISYSSSDSKVAKEVCNMLEGHGIRCWIAPRNIIPGRDYGDVIDDAIICSNVFLFISSFESINSVWCKGELNVAFSEKKTIIPYRIDDTPMRGAVRVMLNQFHWLDASLDFKSAFPKLLETVYSALSRVSEPHHYNNNVILHSHNENSNVNGLSKIIGTIKDFKQAFASVIKIEKYKRISNIEVAVIGRVLYGEVYRNSELLLYSSEGEYQYANAEAFNNISEMPMYSQIVYNSFNNVIGPLSITDFYLELYSANGKKVPYSMKACRGNYVGFRFYNRSDDKINNIIGSSSHMYCIYGK